MRTRNGGAGAARGTVGDGGRPGGSGAAGGRAAGELASGRGARCRLFAHHELAVFSTAHDGDGARRPHHDPFDDRLAANVRLAALGGRFGRGGGHERGGAEERGAHANRTIARPARRASRREPPCAAPRSGFTFWRRSACGTCRRGRLRRAPWPCPCRTDGTTRRRRPRSSRAWSG